MKNQAVIGMAVALMGASLAAQDWSAIQAKIARADAKVIVSMLASYDVFEREAALAQIAREDDNPKLTRAAAAALPSLGSPDARIQLITVLAERNDPAAAPAIRHALRDTDEAVRTAAIIACGQMKDDKAADALIGMYRQTPASENLREALRRIPNPAIDLELVKMFKMRIYTNRAALLDLLAARRYAGVYALAMDPQLFDGSDMTLTRSAVNVIRTYAPEGQFRPLLDFAQKLRPQAADWLLGILTTTLNEATDKATHEQHMVSLLQTCQPDFALTLTALLSISQGQLALSALSKRLASGDVDTRKDAARCLGRWMNEDALPALVFAGKGDRDLGVQNLAWRSLVDVARREEKMTINNRAVAALQEAIWNAPRQAERSAALDAFKTYLRKDGGLRWLLDKIEAERLDLADEVKQMKHELNIR